MKRTIVGGLIGLMAMVGLWTVAPESLARLGGGVFNQIDLLVDVRHEIVSSYVEVPDQERMIEEAVRAMVASLEDRYTVFLASDELAPFDKQVRGSFSGIGAEIDIHDNRLRIVSPLEDSPAWNAGVMAGDTVLEIDGQSTEGITIVDAVSRLTGPEGTTVTIKVRHESGEEQEMVITRARINVQTVRGFRRDADNHWNYMLDISHGIAYIRITQFTHSTAEGVRQALDRLQRRGMKGLILDMRFNPGGLLESAVEVSDLFLEGSKRIVSVKGRAVPERVHESNDDTAIDAIPMVVLANEASASAAEIVTGALSDNQRAKFIGSRTFGKGSVQQVKMLESGLGALKITHAYYYLPSGRNIHRREGKDVWGVDPDDGFFVPMDADQVKNMIEIRRDSGLLRAGGHNKVPATVTPQWVEEKLADIQLAAGLEAITHKLAEGDWPFVGQSGADELVRQSMRANLVRQRNLLDERLQLIERELAELDHADQTEDAESPPLAVGDRENSPAGDQPLESGTDAHPGRPNTVDHRQ